MKKEANRKLLFELPDRNFSYRVGGLLYQEGKILVLHDREEEKYFLPGGHPEFGESSKAALARKIQEETGVAVNVGRLCILAELFFEQENPWHQLQLFYGVEPKNKEALPKVSFPAYDSFGSPKEEYEFCWIDPKEALDLPLKPACIKPYLEKLPEQIVHLQDREEKK
jgi:8-oxo-dGTP pyrophosphatase MutT (NUDIX family)